jgi:hypothetical protein
MRICISAVAKFAHLHKALSHLDVERESAVRWHWQTTLMIVYFAADATVRRRKCSHLGPTILIVLIATHDIEAAVPEQIYTTREVLHTVGVDLLLTEMNECAV